MIDRKSVIISIVGALFGVAIVLIFSFAFAENFNAAPPSEPVKVAAVNSTTGSPLGRPNARMNNNQKADAPRPSDLSVYNHFEPLAVEPTQTQTQKRIKHDSDRPDDTDGDDEAGQTLDETNGQVGQVVQGAVTTVLPPVVQGVQDAGGTLQGLSAAAGGLTSDAAEDLDSQIGNPAVPTSVTEQPLDLVDGLLRRAP